MQASPETDNTAGIRMHTSRETDRTTQPTLMASFPLNRSYNTTHLKCKLLLKQIVQHNLRKKCKLLLKQTIQLCTNAHFSWNRLYNTTYIKMHAFPETDYITCVKLQASPDTDHCMKAYCGCIKSVLGYLCTVSKQFHDSYGETTLFVILLTNHFSVEAILLLANIQCHCLWKDCLRDLSQVPIRAIFQ